MSRNHKTDGMRQYWDDRARENAVYYVDTTCDYGSPDMERFFRTGEIVVREALLDAPVQPTGRQLAVEIGPGLGRVSKALAPHFERVVGIDVSPEMVRRAAELVHEPNVSFTVGDGATLSAIDNATTDLVVTFTVLQHVPNRAAIASYLCEAARVLRPGGVLSAQWNGDAHPVRYRMRGYWWQLQRRAGVKRMQDERAAPQFVGTAVRPTFVRHVLEDAGLTVEATKGLGTLFSWVWARKT
jgi:SAM-dependent methyltransferase